MHSHSRTLILIKGHTNAHAHKHTHNARCLDANAHDANAYAHVRLNLLRLHTKKEEAVEKQGEAWDVEFRGGGGGGFVCAWFAAHGQSLLMARAKSHNATHHFLCTEARGA